MSTTHVPGTFDTTPEGVAAEFAAADAAFAAHEADRNRRFRLTTTTLDSDYPFDPTNGIFDPASVIDRGVAHTGTALACRRALNTSIRQYLAADALLVCSDDTGAEFMLPNQGCDTVLFSIEAIDPEPGD